MPKRERYVWVCTNRRPDGNPKGSCAHHGAEQLQPALKNAIAEAGLHKKVRVIGGGCMDLCWVGAAVAVMPDNTFLKHVTVEDIPKLVAALGNTTALDQNPEIADKIVAPEEFDEPRATVKLGLKRPT